MPLIRSKRVFKIRFIWREPTELDAALGNPVATMTRLWEAYTPAEAWEAARVELGLSLADARRQLFVEESSDRALPAS
jgi:hypothetical protein